MSVVYSCVTDGSPKYDYQACVWAQTLLTLGRRSPDELVVHTLGPQSPFLDVLKKLGIRVVPVQRFDRGHPHSNKLAQLESEALTVAAYVILSDCDLAFADDLAPWIVGDKVRAKIVDLGNPPLGLWREIFHAAGFGGEPEAAVATHDQVPTYVNNFNGGLYILPQEALHKLRQTWPRWSRWTLEQADLLGGHAFHSDQISFGLAMEELALEADPLPVSLNFPTHLPYPNRTVPDVEPVVLHYHDRIDASGFLLEVGLERVDATIRQVNQVLANWRRDDFDNATFWEFRYALHSDLGSGVGSRGESLLAKRSALLPRLRSFRDASVLDVGCGDLEVLGVTPFARYTGVDISQTAIEIARRKRPDGSFFVGDFLTLELPPHDLVICLDVLIHQPTREAYDALLISLLERAKRCLIVSGYNQPPWLTSEITFYYEPLSESIRRLAGDAVAIIGGYRDTTVLLWNRPRSAPEARPASRLSMRRRAKSLIPNWIRGAARVRDGGS